MVLPFYHKQLGNFDCGKTGTDYLVIYVLTSLEVERSWYHSSVEGKFGVKNIIFCIQGYHQCAIVLSPTLIR